MNMLITSGLWGQIWLSHFLLPCFLLPDGVVYEKSCNENTQSHLCAKLHELPILSAVCPGLQIMKYFMVLASKARHTNIMDITGAVAPCGVDKISMSGLGGQNNQIYHDLESRAKYW